MIRLAMVIAIVMGMPALAKAEIVWDGLWFECEFSGRTAPPDDNCAMLDDDGFLFAGDRVTYVKVIDSPETDACKKQRQGQCFRADQPAITIESNRSGKAEFTPTTMGIRFLGCTQIFHATSLGGFIEARPDADRCYWAGEKHFYLKRYDGEVLQHD